ncbi:SGNH/GDSL hydrolase family protein [Reyranella sp. MMS21-HV4-11]|jgi:lysophospholipase L1-like esterase|uniref:SGNH/GDSL hydrolase family protein n=1 Tax=Reyranella humidisoli TaxID=2849149 RepID=A0ABS6IDJ8_9HYPH|nr:SGNH/GDSL hydrolase family protein [Reyranella sp. MMS21-HV4-11]MBU8872662.1 SGNH/GDSL hydrolase family protein [Reyranella sp. MMS21-HV4-11]
MKRAFALLAAAFGLVLATAAAGPAFAQSMTLCRAKPALLELGTTLPISRKAMAEKKVLRIIALGSSTTAGYGVSNPAYAFPTQLRIGLEKALPGIDIEVINRGIGGQDVEEMAARMRTEMEGNPASLVIWQTGTNAAIRQMPIEKFDSTLRAGLKLGTSLGADFVLMNLQYVPAVVAAPDKEAYEKAMAGAAKDFSAGLFRRYDIMRSWYDDGMPYAQFVQLDGLHLNDFGQKCIGRLLTRSILGALTGP